MPFVVEGAVPIAFYRCEKCRREYDSIEGAEYCESGHLIPIAVAVGSYSIRPHPYSLEVTFSDGSVRTYNAESMGG